MNVVKSLDFLRNYSLRKIKGRYGSSDDAGNRALLLSVQSDYNYDLHIPTGYNGTFTKPRVNSLREAIMICYPYEKLEEFSGREYIANILLNRKIDPDYYVNLLKEYNYKWNDICVDEPLLYHLTHLIWGLYMIGDQNHILRRYRPLMTDVLLKILDRVKECLDIRTETLYFLTLINPRKVKEEWIIELEQCQRPDGSYPARDYIEEAHHTALALLTLYNYYNTDLSKSY